MDLKSDTVTSEIWKPIPGFPLYSASSIGRIKRNIDLPNHPAKILNPSNERGYMKVVLIDESGIRKNQRVHRLIAITFIGPKTDKQEVNHKDGNKSNNHFENLEWVTHSENLTHAYSFLKRSHIKGKTHPMAKLCEEQIPEIRRLLREKVKQREIAKMFGVNQRVIWMIKHGQLWNHIKS